ncbi:hypothetical protein AVEN_53196-1 [Araneus ventricosus]|uniref:Uncharacterized protein n=1 Tax=Araneus ventricosus TaxID=182803 RepID=A0A4Y2AAV0_ARAVE|nr:hypothetical protein AVEN_53196-1 [Araneus ventricosus]
MSAFPEFFVRSRSVKCKHHPSILHIPTILMKITPPGACAEARRASESVTKQYTADLQWNLVLNLDPSGSEAETLPLGHRELFPLSVMQS